LLIPTPVRVKTPVRAKAAARPVIMAAKQKIPAKERAVVPRTAAKAKISTQIAGEWRYRFKT
jgi:hypothetical protein